MERMGYGSLAVLLAAGCMGCSSSSTEAFPPQPDASRMDAVVDAPGTVPEVQVAQDAPVAMEVSRPMDVMRTDAARDAGGAMLEAGSSPDGVYDYVINALLVDPDSDPALPHTGFNVDGRHSTVGMLSAEDCGHGDYYSEIDPDQNMGTCPGSGCRGGVDNQLPDFASTVRLVGMMDVQAQLDEQIGSGLLTMLVRVEGVNGELGPTLDDDSVTVSIYRGYALAPRGECRRAFESVTRFVVDNASLRTRGDLATARYRFPGRIVRGRLQVATGASDGAFTLDLPPIMGVNLALNIYATQLRLTLGTTRGIDGNLGGYVLRDELAMTLGMSFPTFRSLIDGFLSGLVDVRTGMPPSCSPPRGGVSMGMGVTAVRATIEATPVSAPPSGWCGGR